MVMVCCKLGILLYILILIPSHSFKSFALSTHCATSIDRGTELIEVNKANEISIVVEVILCFKNHIKQ